MCINLCEYYMNDNVTHVLCIINCHYTCLGALRLRHYVLVFLYGRFHTFTVRISSYFISKSHTFGRFMCATILENNLHADAKIVELSRTFLDFIFCI